MSERRWLPGRGPGTRDSAYLEDEGEAAPMPPMLLALEYLVQRAETHTLRSLLRRLERSGTRSRARGLVELELRRRGFG